MSSPKDQPFKKVLYKRQTCEDNYVSKDFLASMSKNVHIQPYEYWKSVNECIALGQQFTLVVLYALVFMHTLKETFSDKFLIGIDLMLLVIGYFLYYKSETIPISNLSKQLAQNGLLISMLLFLSPILRTLTQSISSDTIYTLTIMLLIVHLIAHDYAYVNANSDKFECYLSLNSVIAVSILFASRLASALHSFGIIAFAILAFIMFPYLRHNIKKSSQANFRWITWTMAIFTSIAILLSLSIQLASLYVMIMIFIVFLVPAWLMTAQSYKDEISGPWDEAVVVGIQNVEDGQ